MSFALIELTSSSSTVGESVPLTLSSYSCFCAILSNLAINRRLLLSLLNDILILLSLAQFLIDGDLLPLVDLLFRQVPQPRQLRFLARHIVGCVLVVPLCWPLPGSLLALQDYQGLFLGSLLLVKDARTHTRLELDHHFLSVFFPALLQFELELLLQ